MSRLQLAAIDRAERLLRQHTWSTNRHACRCGRDGDYYRHIAKLIVEETWSDDDD